MTKGEMRIGNGGNEMMTHRNSLSKLLMFCYYSHDKGNIHPCTP